MIPHARRVMRSRFTHVPWTEAIGDYLGMADLALMTSDSEGLSLASCEYLAFGLPLLSTPVGLVRKHPEWFGLLPKDATPEQVACGIAAGSSRTTCSWLVTAPSSSQGPLCGNNTYINAFVNPITRQTYLESLADQFPPPQAVPVILPDSGNHKVPGFASRVVSFAGALASHVLAGSPQVTEEEHARRLAICRAPCVFYENRDGQDYCKGCGCSGAMFQELKTRWSDQACPKGFWPAIAKDPAPETARA